MPPAPPGIQPLYPERGYVLFDVLIALLLLAGTLLGAGFALVQSLAASRAAALQTSAVDLLANLVESLQAVPERQRVIAEWTATVANQLPAGAGGANSPVESPGEPPVTDIVITWRDHADAQPFRLNMPVVLPPMQLP